MSALWLKSVAFYRSQVRNNAERVFGAAKRALSVTGKGPFINAIGLVFSVAGRTFDGRASGLCITAHTGNRITGGGRQCGGNNSENHKFAHGGFLEA